MSDRYLRIVLTIIAIELGWLGVKDAMPVPVAAQATQTATRVLITGIDLQARTQALPVAIAGGVRGTATPGWATAEPLRLDAIEQPVRAQLGGTVNTRIIEPVRVDTSQPLLVRSVQAEGAPRPGL